MREGWGEVRSSECENLTKPRKNALKLKWKYAQFSCIYSDCEAGGFSSDLKKNKCRLIMDIFDNESFYVFLNEYADQSKTRIYRGAASDKYTLIPSIGRQLMRKDNKTSLNETDEGLIFRHFKQRAQPFLAKDVDDMNLLAIAQHHGLPTRLLDWTFNPLAAAYFAVEDSIVQPADPKKQTLNSVIYVYDKPTKAVINKKFKSIVVDKLEFFIPNYNDGRIVNQNGLFTVHPFPWTELIDENIKTISIDLEYRRDLRKLLNRLGVNKSTVYPGLDGVAEHIKWMQTNFY